MEYPHLFSPAKIGNLDLANRFVVAPIVTNYGTPDGSVTDRLLAYWEARAKGGWGLLISEATTIDPGGRGFPNQLGVWQDRLTDGLSQLSAAAHRHGAKMLLQLQHSGRQTVSAVAGAQPVAPSPIPCPVLRETPRELSEDEIWRLVERFGDAAIRARDAGFDGVEVHGGHGYLVAEFMSTYANQRADSFGGSLENRLRFPTEIIKRVKARAGADFPVSFRFSSEEKVPGGLTLDDAKLVARAVQEAGADAVSVSAGVYESLHYLVSPATMTPGFLLPNAAEIRGSVSVPVIAVGRLTHPGLAEEALATGKADLIAWGRQSLADPETPKKIAEGRLEEITWCDACLKECIGRLLAGLDIACAVNPACGKEHELGGGTTRAAA